MSKNTKRRSPNGNSRFTQQNEKGENGKEQKGKIIVLDTSVLVHDPESLDILREAGNAILVIPWIVLEELDLLKGKPNVGPDAREVIRRIEELSQMSRNGDENFRIEPTPSGKHFKDLQKTNPDHQIIATARAIQAISGHEFETVLMTRDIIIRIIARKLGIKTEDYPYNQVDTRFQPELKAINVPGDRIHDMEFDYDSSKIEIYHNEGVVCYSHLGDGSWEAAFCALYKGNNRFKVIPDDLSALGLKPFSLGNGSGSKKNNDKDKDRENSLKNWSQYVAIAQLLDPDINLVFLQGGAGAGKTLIALAGALEQRRNYNNIVIARPMIHLEDRDDIGYLPGSLDQKMAPWIEPILQAFSFLGAAKEGNHELIAKLQENKKIIIKPLDYVRGETYHKSFMIIDEAQNLTPHQVKTIITRAGLNTKMVFTGDLGQIDRNRRLDRRTSGLAYAMDRMAGNEMVGAVNFRDTVRSPLASLAEGLL